MVSGLSFTLMGRHAHDNGFKGNKQALPSKPCTACGRPMTWRRKWAKVWDEVLYCSDACRLAARRERR